ncbi:hypothetical protein [Sorangium sp. So ce406]
MAELDQRGIFHEVACCTSARSLVPACSRLMLLARPEHRAG